MEWQSSADTVPSSFITEAQARSVLGKPPATGAWRDGDPVGHRQFLNLGPLTFEAGGGLPASRLAYETWGLLSPAGDNAVLVLHALTGDSHVVGSPGPGHETGGWWDGIVGPGLAIDTDVWFVVAPNMLGGCQGSTGPASLAPDGLEWGIRFPYLTIRDQVTAQRVFSDRLGIDRWAAVVGGSMGGMHALEWAIETPDRVDRLIILAAPPRTTADQIGLNSVQIQAIRTDPAFRAGDYYDEADGDGPTRGLALARRMALLNYRSPAELNARFDRGWQSGISPLGANGRFAVESYLDFHGNKFTRRFDANSYIVLVEAMNSHDVGRDRGGVAAALGRVSARSVVVGIDSDRLFPVAGQRTIAAHLLNNIDGPTAVVLESGYGHDGFLIENAAIGVQIRRVLH
ncbi:homoserine O-acetyltransferase MetX [Cryobacterium ruanii]|uniref:Homoserine O-acetyltransferase n=1 Tax=Cryobacterium ruanii TaxID=1259197 RepID=A0A4R9AL24_9MICO|nr:homoserine O-acetyltransferase [Cryobacterium ruanii]TFD63638.1 homoserine O-acetyltransferase [Cryobacterium ruanii]